LLVYGLLFSRTRQRLSAHLAACPMCRTERFALEEARKLQSFLQSLAPAGILRAARWQLAAIERIRPIGLRASVTAVTVVIWSVCMLQLARGLPELSNAAESAPLEPLGFDYRQPQPARTWGRFVPGALLPPQSRRPPNEVMLVLWVTDPAVARRTIDTLLATVSAAPLAIRAGEPSILTADVPASHYTTVLERITALGLIDYVSETPSSRPRPAAPDSVRLQIELRQDRWGVSPKL
jgi:hypothetical protein